MIVIVILIMDMLIKQISKTHFCHQKCENIYYHYGGEGHLSCTYCTPKHLTNNEKNIETHFAYEDGDSDYGHMDATHLNYFLC